MRQFFSGLILASILGIGLAACSGGGDSDPAAESEALTFSYAAGRGLYRVGEAIAANDPLFDPGAAFTQFSIQPTLPAGLDLDSTTGTISGTPAAETPLTTYTISASNGDETLVSTIELAVGPQLLDVFASMEPGFAAEVILPDANIPVRMALAPDGRLFFNELASGNIRIVDANGTLLTDPFATLQIVAGNEKGLLGLVLDPDFTNTGYVYVKATVPGNNNQPDRAQIVRFTDVDNIGEQPTLLVDDLPIGEVHNGGELVFDHLGHLFVGRGDVTDPETSQTDGVLAGKVLRYTATGGIPSDNPIPGDPEWCRGLRNTFAMTVHPTTGELFGVDEGPTNDDELNYLVAGKNFVWGMEEEPEGSGIGFTMQVWHEVITPTGLLFHTGNGGWNAFQNNIFLTSYNFEDIRRLVVTGSAFTDVIREIEFAQFNDDGINNKPLHILEAPDGSLYVSTFSAIYRIFKYD